MKKTIIDFRKKKFSIIDIKMLKYVIKELESINKNQNDFKPTHILFQHDKLKVFFLDEESVEEVKKSGKLTISDL